MDVAGGPRQPLDITRRDPVHILLRTRTTASQTCCCDGYRAAMHQCASDVHSQSEWCTADSTCAARFQQLLDLALGKHVVEQLDGVLRGVGHSESDWDRLQINRARSSMSPLQATHGQLIK